MINLRRQNIAGLAAAVALVAVATLLVYRPQSRKLDEIRQNVASAQESLMADTRRASIVPELVRQIDEMKKRYSGFERKLPPNQDLGEFLAQITNDLKEEALSDAEIEPKSPLKGELYQTLPILMRCEGSYLSVASFLQRLDKMQRLARVHTLRILPGQKGSSFQVEMLLNIYFTES